MHKWLMAAVVLFAVPAMAGDPEDVEGVEEHPEVPRMPGFYIHGGTSNDFNSYTFPSQGYEDGGEPKGSVTKEGKYWEIEYGIKEGKKPVSFVELTRNFENAFKKRGGTMTWKGSAEGSSEAVYTLKTGKSERWLHLHWFNGGHDYRVKIIDVAEMEQKLELSANEMAEEIEKNGFVALRGILFDTGKDVIKPESEPLLAEIVSLLGSNKSLKVSIEGHTDNVGDKKSNLALSKKRAESVRKYLVSKGVDGKRLKADGKGDTAPVADNRTEEGRAQNRRVELVKF